MKDFIYNHFRVRLCCMLLALTSAQFLTAGTAEMAYENNATEKDIIDVLNQMSEYYQVFFSYDNELLKDVKVNFDIKKEEIFDHAIKRLMKETVFDYTVYSNKYLVIFKNDSKGKKAAKKMGKVIKEMEKLESEGNLSL